jgi:hypothetical protein
MVLKPLLKKDAPCPGASAAKPLTKAIEPGKPGVA